jgi:hypothetical protein
MLNFEYDIFVENKTRRDSVEYLLRVRFYDCREWTAMSNELLWTDIRNRSYIYLRILQGLFVEIQQLSV